MSTKYNPDGEIVHRRACRKFCQYGRVCAVFDSAGICQKPSSLTSILAQHYPALFIIDNIYSFFFPSLPPLNDDIVVAPSTCCHDSVIVPVILSPLILSVVEASNMELSVAGRTDRFGQQKGGWVVRDPVLPHSTRCIQPRRPGWIRTVRNPGKLRMCCILAEKRRDK